MTDLKAEIINNTLLFSFAYDPRIVSAIKRMPGRFFNPKTGQWGLSVDGLIGTHIKTLQGLGFDLTDVSARLNAPVVGHPIASNSHVWASLRPYQAIKAQNAVDLRGGLIRGFCGCGKTIISLAVMQALNCKRVLVVCPKSVLINWQREIKMWLNMPARVITGTPGQRVKLYDHDNPFTIVTYDTMRIDLAHLSGEWDAVIFDEAHTLSNTTSLRHKAAVALKAKYKYGLTATPLPNANPTEIYAVMKSLGYSLGNFKLYTERYIHKDYWGSPDYYLNIPELRERIKPWMVPIDLEEAKFELPPRTDTDLEFELSEKETSLYDRIKKELLFELEQSEVSKLSSPMILQNTLTKLGKLQELTDSCELIGESNQSTKLEILKEHLENNLNDQKAIIFTRFSRMAEIIYNSLSAFGPCLLDGSIPTDQRQKLIDEFTNNPTRRIFISTEAGNAGINLQAANIVYNYDLPFSLGKLEQRLGRIRWHQQTAPVFFYNLIAKLHGGRVSIDDWVLKKIIKKQGISDQLLLSDIKEALQ